MLLNLMLALACQASHSPSDADKSAAAAAAFKSEQLAVKLENKTKIEKIERDHILRLSDLSKVLMDSGSLDLAKDALAGGEKLLLKRLRGDAAKLAVLKGLHVPDENSQPGETNLLIYRDAAIASQLLQCGLLAATKPLFVNKDELAAIDKMVKEAAGLTDFERHELVVVYQNDKEQLDSSRPDELFVLHGQKSDPQDEIVELMLLQSRLLKASLYATKKTSHIKKIVSGNSFARRENSRYDVNQLLSELFRAQKKRFLYLQEYNVLGADIERLSIAHDEYSGSRIDRWHALRHNETLRRRSKLFLLDAAVRVLGKRHEAEIDAEKQRAMRQNIERALTQELNLLNEINSIENEIANGPPPLKAAPSEEVHLPPSFNLGLFPEPPREDGDDGSFFKKIGKPFKELIEEVVKPVEELADEVQKPISELVDEIGKPLKELYDELDSGVRVANETQKRVFKEVIRGIDRIGEKVEEETGATIGDGVQFSTDIPLEETKKKSGSDETSQPDDDIGGRQPASWQMHEAISDLMTSIASEVTGESLSALHAKLDVQTKAMKTDPLPVSRHAINAELLVLKQQLSKGISSGRTISKTYQFLRTKKGAALDFKGYVREALYFKTKPKLGKFNRATRKRISRLETKLKALPK
ncbi:hypothetical protein OAH18_01105 [bacterium]|nr:hypothetical protein [bacterium]